MAYSNYLQITMLVRYLLSETIMPVRWRPHSYLTCDN